jgi:hypothetical protein
MTSPTEWSVDELTDAILRALERSDLQVMYGLLLLLANKDAELADLLRRAAKAALGMARSQTAVAS